MDGQIGWSDTERSLALCLRHVTRDLLVKVTTLDQRKLQGAPGIGGQRSAPQCDKP